MLRRLVVISISVALALACAGDPSPLPLGPEPVFDPDPEPVPEPVPEPHPDPDPAVPAGAQVGCTEAEATLIGESMERIYAATLIAYQGGADFAQLLELYAQEGQLLETSLSPMCQEFLARMQQYQQAQPQAAPPSFDGGIYYDAGSDTYTSPNQVACGPSGCIGLQ